MWQTVRAVRAAIDECGADAVVTNGIKPHCVGALAAGTRARWPLVWYLRDSLEERRLSRYVLGPLSNRCRGAIAISNYVKDDARNYVRPAVPVSVIYNIVDAYRRVAPAADVEKETGTVWFAMIGALTPIKGHDTFFAAAARVMRQLPQARFLIVGGAGYRTEKHLNYEQQLRAKAAALGLESRTRFLGHRNDIPALLPLIDVLVQPNTGPEGFGRSVAEAMAAGIPVIATDRWSLSELLEHDRSGWLFPKGDVDALAGLMLRLGGDASLRRSTADCARRRVEERFSAAAAVEAFDRVVAGAIHGTGS
jgi:glycosyltransferase involved in cell wall biosynthesis